MFNSKDATNHEPNRALGEWQRHLDYVASTLQTGYQNFITVLQSARKIIHQLQNG